MRPPSACPCRGGIPWQGVLLAVSLLTIWNLHPTASLTIVPVPFNVAEGRDVLLLVHNVSENTAGYQWYRGEITDRSHLIVSYSNLTHSATQGPAFSGRETIYPNGSLLFVNVTKGDTGFYTLQATTANFDSEAATGEFRVHGPVTPPHLTASNTTVAEGETVELTCIPNDTGISIQWLFNDKTLPLTDRMQLSPNNSILTISLVLKMDEAEYQCQVSNPISSLKSNPITLTVIGLVAQPSLRATNTEPQSVAMTCLSGDPGISITWIWIFNSQTLQLTDRMQLSLDHRTLSIDPVRQEDAGEYQSEERTPGLPVGAVAGIVTGVLVGVALVAALGCFLLHTRTGRASVQHGLRDHRTPASRPGQDPSESSTSLAPPPGHGAAVPIYQELLNPDLDIYCRVDHKADVDS
ncbi:cell adhesion molecule CEACAM21-like [Callospermophilus lateralis]